MGRKQNKKTQLQLVPPAQPGSLKASAPKPASIKSVGVVAPAKASSYTPRRLAALAFGLAGGAVGFLHGINVWPPLPGTNSPIDLSVWTGAMLGMQKLDPSSAIQSALLGLIVGRGAALSVGLPVSQLLIAWFLGAFGLIAGYMLGQSLLFASVGCFLGYSAVLLKNRLTLA